MPSKKSNPQPYIEYHKDGSIHARGQLLDGVPTGYWEWFRKNGIKMRSGSFQDGEPVGEWITYDQKGDIYKVTKKKPVIK